MKNKMSKYVSALFLFGALVSTSVFSAESYPQKPVTLMVGFAPGGATDFLARMLAAEFSKRLGQPFVVVNKPGANSGIAISTVASEKPDGYTLLVVPVGLAINELIYDGIDYSIDDFEPIGLIGKMPNVIIVNKKLNINNLKEFIDYSKNHKDLAFAAPAAGSSAHLSSELFKYKTNASLMHVPYNGDGPAIVAIRGGVVDVGFVNLSAAAGMIQSGDVTPLAITTKTRSPNFPDIPTIAESGVPDYEVSSYFGLGAPAGTPPNVVRKLNEVMMDILEKPEVHTRLTEMGFLLERNTPDDFKQFLISENTKWRPVVKETGMSLSASR